MSHGILGLHAHPTGTQQQPIRVRIQSGQYAVREPLVFESQDSGTEQCPVSYLGDPGKQPIISGGRQITGWKKQGDRWVTHLPEVEVGHLLPGKLAGDGAAQQSCA
jgi:hypothetical protein